MENLQETLERIYGLLIRYGMKFVIAVVVLILGLIVILDQMIPNVPFPDDFSSTLPVRFHFDNVIGPEFSALQ